MSDPPKKLDVERFKRQVRELDRRGALRPGGPPPSHPAEPETDQEKKDSPEGTGEAPKG